VIFIFKKGLIWIFFIFFVTQTVWAEKVYFRLDQSKIRLNIPPGNSQAGTIIIHSQSDEEINLQVYLEDWEYTDKQDGTKHFFPAQSTLRSCAEWIKFSPAEFTLPAWGEKRLNYIVSIPQDATGGRYAVMFFQTLLSQPTQTQTSEYLSDGEIRSGVNLAIRIGTLFYVEAEGTIERRAELKNLSVSADGKDKPLSISVDLLNAGNVDITAGGTFNIIDKQGSVYARGEFNEVGTFSGDVAKLTSSWTKPLPEGIYDLILTINLGKTIEVKRPGTIPVITQEAEIVIDAQGKVISIGQLR
jgi:hypothetical protein